MARKSTKVSTPQKGSIARRRFLSSAIVGGAVISLGGNEALARNGEYRAAQLVGDSLPQLFVNNAPDCPTGLGAIDSLNASLAFLDSIYGKAVCPFQENVIEKTASLAEEYEKLMRLAAKLEDEAPQLKDSAGISKIKKAARAGKDSVDNLNNLANTRATLTMGLIKVSAAAVEGNDLLASASALSNQQGSITLSPAAAKTLRALLSEIRRIHELVSGANTASQKLGKASTDAYAHLGTIRSAIFKALSALANRDKVKTFTEIETARNQLKSIDDTYSEKLAGLSDKAKTRCIKQNSMEAPGAFLSDYLDGTKELINEEIAASSPREGGAEFSVRFVKASYVAGPTPEDLVPLMSSVLRNNLVQDNDSRRRSGARNVRPFVRHRNKDVRIGKFAEALKEIDPAGEFDYDSEKRRAAATELHNLLVAKGW